MAEPTVHFTMSELIEHVPCARTVLSRRGMACVGCPMARFETVAEAAEAYGFDPHELLHELASEGPPRSTRRAKPRSSSKRSSS